MPPRDLRLNPPIPALHPERDALLAAVRDADPADDLPALVYADWQDEHGQPEHAELIRVMVELAKARKQDKASKERRPKLLARMKELFKTPPLKPLRKLETDTWKFSRGFIRDFTLNVVAEVPVFPRVRPGNEFLVSALHNLPERVPFDKLAWLGVMLPIITTVEHVSALAAAPWLRRLSRLEMYRWDAVHIGKEELAPLIASKHLGGLLCFEPHETIGAGALTGLYLAKSASALREFPLESAQRFTTTDEYARPNRNAFLSAVEQIVSAKRAKQFTSFGDAVADMDEALAKILLASKHLTGIRTFRYVFTKVTAKTQAAFVERFGKPERV
jgi:uncharacterized protein (TIGR02996 family)